MTVHHNSIVRVAPADRLAGYRRFALIVGIAVVIASGAAGEAIAAGTSSAHPDQQATPPIVAPDPSNSDALAEASRLQKEADTHIDARQFRDATEKTQRALDLRRQHLGENHSDVAYSISRLGTLA